jgi:hypothetical protein
MYEEWFMGLLERLMEFNGEDNRVRSAVVSLDQPSLASCSHYFLCTSSKLLSFTHSLTHSHLLSSHDQGDHASLCAVISNSTDQSTVGDHSLTHSRTATHSLTHSLTHSSCSFPYSSLSSISIPPPPPPLPHSLTTL